jgi:hypothetical protein
MLKLLNGITLRQQEPDSLNQMITVTDYFIK